MLESVAIQTIFALLILIVTIVLMLAMNRLKRDLNSSTDLERENLLRKELEKSPKVVGKNNLFHDFLVRRDNSSEKRTDLNPKISRGKIGD